jgi:hypothetical protein
MIAPRDEQRLGEFKGNEFGARPVMSDCYGPDADRLFEQSRPNSVAS